MHKPDLTEKGRVIESADKAMILLHGRGASARDIMLLADEFCDDRFYIAAPQATNNTWYPYSFMAPESDNEPWLSSAVNTVKSLIDDISRHIPVDQIYLMGFSQGACLAVEVAARYARRYAGIAAFTGGLIGETIDSDKYSGDFAGTPVYLANSDQDPHIPVSRSEESKRILEIMGGKVTLEIYPGMPHTIIREEIEKVKEIMF
jgi:phospholipase/carboxylesterase